MVRKADTHKRRTATFGLAVGALALALAAAGCGGAAPEKQGAGTAAPATGNGPADGAAPAAEQAAPAPGGIDVTGIWARTAATGERSAVYFILKNNGKEDDRLTGASADVAGKTEVHETVSMDPSQMPAGQGMTQEMTQGMSQGMTQGTMDQQKKQMPGMSGAMKMRPVESVPLPAGGTVEFKPGGLHVMLLELKRDLKAGDAFAVTLKFEKAGPQTVQVTVREP